LPPPSLPKGIDEIARKFNVDPKNLKRFRSKGSKTTDVLMIIYRNGTPEELVCVRCRHRVPLIPPDEATEDEIKWGPDLMESHTMNSHNAKPEYWASYPDEVEKILAHALERRLQREDRENFSSDSMTD
jgi:hypothetical protein